MSMRDTPNQDRREIDFRYQKPEIIRIPIPEGWTKRRLKCPACDSMSWDVRPSEQAFGGATCRRCEGDVRMLVVNTIQIYIK